MDYLVSRAGKEIGMVSLAELHRRRRTGEFNGTEFVWRDGMPQWAGIDYILAHEGFAGQAASPSSSSNPLVWVTVIIVIAILTGASFTGYIVYKSFTSARKVATQKSIQRSYKNKVGGSSYDVKIASKPITWTSNTLTQAEVLQRQRLFRDRQWIDAYEINGDHSQPYDATAREFLTTWLDSNYNTRKKTRNERVVELGDQIVNQKCQDPLLLTVAGNTGIEEFENTRRLEAAVAGYNGTKYLAYPRFYATAVLASHLKSDSGRLTALDAACLQLLEQCFTDGSIKPADQWEAADILGSGWGSAFFRRNESAVQKVIENAGKPYEWLALTLEGKRQIDLAWAARGSGYSDSVTEKGWAGFSSHMTTARQKLTAAWKLDPTQPLPAAEMITVSMAESSLEDMRSWFDRALAAQLDHDGAWNSMRWGLRPRWFGSHESILALGVAGVNTKRFDSDAPRKIFDCIMDIESELQTPPGEHIYGRSDIWPHLQGMYSGYIAEPKQEAWRDGWRTSFACVAYFAHQYGVARQQLEALKWQPASQSLSGWGRDLSLMHLEVAARTGPVSNSISKAEALYLKADTNALAAYKDLGMFSGADAKTAEFVHQRLSALELEQVLRSRTAVPLLPSRDNDPLWVYSFGKPRHLDNGDLEVESGPNGHLLYWHVRMRPPFEVTGEFDVVESSDGNFQAGVVMGYPDLQTFNWYGFRVKRNNNEKDVVAFGQGWSSKQVYQKANLDPKHNTFMVRVKSNRVTAEVNGQELLHETQLPAVLRLAAHEYYLGLGAYNDANHTVIRYHNVQARKLERDKKSEAKETADQQ
jgi:hypothetical protein